MADVALLTNLTRISKYGDEEESQVTYGVLRSSSHRPLLIILIRHSLKGLLAGLKVPLLVV